MRKIVETALPNDIIYSEYLVPYTTEQQKLPGVIWKNKEIESYMPARLYRPSKQPAECKLVVFLHGGPGLSIGDGADSPYIKFFTDLVNAGFTVVAPEIRGSKENKDQYDQFEYDGRLYIKDIGDIVKNFKKMLSPKKTLGIFHSWGGHQGGNAIINLENDLLDGVIHMAGTAYPAATDFYRNAWHFAIGLDALPIHAKGSLARYIIDYKSWEFMQVSKDDERKYGNKRNLPSGSILLAESFMLNSNFIKKISYAENIDKTPNIPYFIIHCLDDKIVPASLSSNLNKELIKNNKKVFALFRPTGGHSWFKNNTYFDQKAYDAFMPKIIAFLTGEYNQLETIDPQVLDKQLAQHNKIDFVEQHKRFLAGKKISLDFISRNGQQAILNLEKGILSYIQRYEALRAQCEPYLNTSEPPPNLKGCFDEEWTFSDIKELNLREKQAIQQLKARFDASPTPQSLLFALKDKPVKSSDHSAKKYTKG